MTLAILEGGTYYHEAAIRGPRYRDAFDRILYAPELRAADLEGVRLLIVPDRVNPALLRRLRPLLLGHLARGGTLVVFGENRAETWAPGVEWSFRPTNFWWWLERGAEPAQRIAAPDHELFRFVPPADTVWHFHGVLHPPKGAVSLIDLPATEPGGEVDGGPGSEADGGPARGVASAGSLLYDDRVTTAGRLIISTLDPFYHHGSNFMPATTRFLDGFVPWARHAADRMAPQSPPGPPLAGPA